MDKQKMMDALFREAVSAIDTGDAPTLERLLADYPQLVRERLEAPGSWLRDQIGDALEGFFAKPYLLWFVAEDPVRTGKLPPNIADMTHSIIEAAKREGVESLQEQLDYALLLISWSWIARECGVQIALIDVLIDAGAAAKGCPNNALVNGNFAAAAHLVERGAPLTLAAALCLERWEEVGRLATAASAEEKQFGLILAALNGKFEAVRQVLSAGAEVNTPCANLYSHATALHHAVCSGSLETIKVLVDAGAGLEAQDTAYQGTPLGWAEHYLNENQNEEKKTRYAEIAAYLREKQEQT